jgi:uncharacterized protein YdaU (DUF1376 family)
MKAPAFQFYPADYLTDEKVAIMTLEQEGVYLRLMCYCWREGSIPSDPEVLSRLCKGAPTTVLGLVVSCFKQHPTEPSRLIHMRLEAERVKQEAWRQKSAEGGKKSSSVRSGDKTKPKLDQSPSVEQPPANHQPTTVTRVVEAIGNTSSSSLSSSSKGGAEPNAPPKSPPPAEPRYSIEETGMPVGLDSLQYARGLLERCNIPHSFANQRAAGSAIEAYAKERGIPLHRATEALMEMAKADIARGENVSKFWFEDGKYRKQIKRPVVKVPDAAERQMAEDRARMQQQEATRSVVQ